MIKINIITLTGRLTADPELKYTQSGKAFTRFSLAVTRSFDREKTDFINCQAWGKIAEIAAEYLKKGNRAGVNGRLAIDLVEKEGENKKYTNVVVEQLEFLESKNQSENIKVDNNKVVEEQESDFPF